MCLSVCCVNADDEEKRRRPNPLLAGAGRCWGHGTKHHPAPEVFLTPLINRLKLQKYTVNIYINIKVLFCDLHL